MILLRPYMLGLFLLIPALIAAYLLAQRRRHRYALRYSSLTLVKEAMGRGPGVRRHISPLLYLVGLASMIFAAARPVAITTFPSDQGTVILTVDVSGSMAADDVKPSRMEAAKEAAIAFVDHQPSGVRIGVISFSSEAALVQAPTEDRDAIMTAINNLRPVGGTAIGSAIQASLEAILPVGAGESLQSALAGAPLASTPVAQPTPLAKGSFAPAVVILLTDGENTEGPSPIEVAQLAMDRGIRVYTIGLGTPGGAILHIQGMSIRTSLDEPTLRQVASMTGATYSNAATEEDLRAIYEKLGTRLVLKPEKTEITAEFTVLAAFLSIVAGALSLVWFNRLP